MRCDASALDLHAVARATGLRREVRARGTERFRGSEVLCRRDLARINNAGEQVVPRTVFKRLAELLAERNIDIEKLLPKVEAAGKEGS